MKDKDDRVKWDTLCPKCQSQEHEVFESEYAEPLDGQSDILQCGDCGHKFRVYSEWYIEELTDKECGEKCDGCDSFKYEKDTNAYICTNKETCNGK